MIKINKKTLKYISTIEHMSCSELEKNIAAGYTVIPKNNSHKLAKPCAIGKGLATKVNANIGLSKGNSNINDELKKMEIAVKAGTDTVMDLSTGPDLMKALRKIMSECPVPVGTVPVYALACNEKKRIASLKEKDFLRVVEEEAVEGVDFFTIHAGIRMDAVKYISTRPRLINIVSRGGSILAAWMITNGKENPYYTYFDEVLDILKKYNVTLSLGDSLRPGSILDATDKLQIQELVVLGELQKKALSRGVQVMIEGPGHVPLDQIEANVKLEKSICNGAPFYVLGPLVTDAAPGYDHIVSAIGGAIAASHGADYLCYVTPAEHLKLPDIDDVRRGVIASKIAAHAADIVKKVPGAVDRDIEMSKARARRDWKTQFKFAIDPVLPTELRKSSNLGTEDVCTMCSDYCSMKITEETVLAAQDKRGGK
ncbi:MAG TPA: phosphomethylpyrimidine synthase ThiC [Candidatus Omnitrophota bacterium]|nr:phosphomethylpyrimidine synthase ThiC [Candidatus Omnitrophota bacterium]HPS19978.1 phosphomethylpyrimidine synthase ThiC [Candidatus Omnitrophota bacterium]